MRCGRTFRLARTHPAHARSSGSETLSRSRSLADYTIDMHESEFSEATRPRLERASGKPPAAPAGGCEHQPRGAAPPPGPAAGDAPPLVYFPAYVDVLTGPMPSPRSDSAPVEREAAV